MKLPDDPAPIIDPAQGFAFEMEVLEKQPRVKAGDHITLPDGTSVKLKKISPDCWVVTREDAIRGTRRRPDCLGFFYKGRMHIGAINGHLTVGMDVAGVFPRDVIEEVIEDVRRHHG